MKDEHLTCRVTECLSKPAANQYRLSCTNSVFTQLLPESDITKSSSTHFLPLERWRISPRVTIRYAWSDPHNLHKCRCEIPRAKSTTIDLTDTEPKKETPSSGQTMIDLTNGQKSQPSALIKNLLYVRRTVSLSPPLQDGSMIESFKPRNCIQPNIFQM